ncbi:F0F1 ATP synthase subunit delta [Candidatus Saccharibacteria bacterium]|nr:F0F1 ATP synthase subunit delta [Candidatus Saccharibacteria bacterium]
MSPKFSRAKLAQEIIKRLDKGESAEKISQEVAALLISVGKTSELSSLLRDCTKIRVQRDGIVEVNAVTARPLDKDLERYVEKTAKDRYKNAHKVIIHNRVDPDIIGGISLSFVDSSLDLSIRARLNKLKALTT